MSRVKPEVPSEDYDGIRPNNGFRGGGGGSSKSEYGGFDVDDVAAREMAACGLPTSFSMGNNSMTASMQEAAPAPSNTRKGEKKTFYSKSGVEVLMIESKRMSLTTVLKMSDLSRVTSVQIFPIWLGATFSC